MKHARSHIRQLAQFAIRQHFDDARVFHFARIADHKSVHVRPVLVYRRAHRFGDYRARNVRPAARERLYPAVRAAPVKSGHDRFYGDAQPVGSEPLRFIVVQPAVPAEAHNVRRVDELVAEQSGKHFRGQIFAAADYIVVGIALLAAEDRLVVRGKIEIQSEPVYYPVETPRYLREQTAFSVRRRLVTERYQHIRHFGVRRFALAGRGYDDVSRFGIGADYIRDLAYAVGVRH